MKIKVNGKIDELYLKGDLESVKIELFEESKITLINVENSKYLKQLECLGSVLVKKK